RTWRFVSFPSFLSLLCRPSLEPPVNQAEVDLPLRRFFRLALLFGAHRQRAVIIALALDSLFAEMLGNDVVNERRRSLSVTQILLPDEQRQAAADRERAELVILDRPHLDQFDDHIDDQVAVRADAKHRMK